MAFNLQGTLSLDGSGWKKGLADAEKSAAGFGKSLQDKIAAAFSIGAVASMTKSIVEFADKIGDMAKRLNVSTDYLQEMNYLLKQNGASADDLLTVMEKISSARVAAVESPDGSQSKAFQKFGITDEQIRTAHPEDLLDQIGRVFKTKGSTPELVAAWREIGGRGAGVMINSFLDGLEEGRAAAKNAGAVVSQEDLAAIKDAADAFERLTIIIKANLAPALTAAIDFFEWASAQIREAFGFAIDFVGKFSFLDAIKDFFTGGGALNPFDGMKAIAESKNFKEAMNAGTANVAGIEKDYQAAAAKEVARRGNAFNPSPMEAITGGQSAAVSAPKIKAAASDALVSVGNFLGSSGAKNTIENIQNKLLLESQKQTGYLKKMTDQPKEKTIKVSL